MNATVLERGFGYIKIVAASILTIDGTIAAPGGAGGAYAGASGTVYGANSAAP